MEDIDGGLHPAVDGQSLDDDEMMIASPKPRRFAVCVCARALSLSLSLSLCGINANPGRVILKT